MDCRCRLSDWILKKDKRRPLSIPFGFNLGTVIGDVPGEKCHCYICFVASLSGPRLKAFVAGQKDSAVEGRNTDMKRCNTCFDRVKLGEKHTCGGKQELLDNLREALPLKTRQQLALETIRETEQLIKGAAGDCLKRCKGSRSRVLSPM